MPYIWNTTSEWRWKPLQPGIRGCLRTIYWVSWPQSRMALSLRKVRDQTAKKARNPEGHYWLWVEESQVRGAQDFHHKLWECHHKGHQERRKFLARVRSKPSYSGGWGWLAKCPLCSIHFALLPCIKVNINTADVDKHAYIFQRYYMIAESLLQDAATIKGKPSVFYSDWQNMIEPLPSWHTVLPFVDRGKCGQEICRWLW